MNTRETYGDQGTLDRLLAHTLTELYEDGVTTVRPCAFYNNTGLESVTLPNATAIGAQAFYGCSALTALTLPGEAFCALDGSAALGGTPIAGGTGYVYVPEKLLSAYKSASGWSAYANQLAAIEEGTA